MRQQQKVRGMNNVKNTLYMIFPAYNEEANIRQTVADWYPVLDRCGGPLSRMVVIDDGSRDRTYEILLELAAEYPRLIALTKPNSGHGPTVRFGYQYALEAGADYIFQTDSDGQTAPEEFDAFWRRREGYDLLIGNRAHREDGLDRVVITRVLRLVLLGVFGVYVQDANTPYRLMSADSLSRVLRQVPERFNLANVLVTVLYHKEQLRVRYLPITFRPRQGGENSIDLPKILRMGLQAVRDFRKIRRTIC